MKHKTKGKNTKKKEEPSRKDIRKARKDEKKKKAQLHQAKKQERSLAKIMNHAKPQKPNKNDNKGIKMEERKKQKQVEFNEEDEMGQISQEEDEEMQRMMEEFDEIGEEGQSIDYQNGEEGEQYDEMADNYEDDDEEEDYGPGDGGERNSEDERIDQLEGKLGIKGPRSKKYDQMAKDMGFDDDLFDFLDGISSKVKTAKKEKKKKQIPTSNQKKLAKKQLQIRKQSLTKQQPDLEQQKNQKPEISSNPWKPENLEVRKGMNGLFNKISDGNILYTVRSFVEIFEANPKSVTITTFSNLFIRFNLFIQKPLIHVLSANVVVAVALHRIYGDRLMAQILYDLTKGFENLDNQVEDPQEIQEIGYSRVFEKKKNYFTILCFFYEFGSVSATFIQTLIEKLALNLKANIEFLYIIIQKCGAKMRADDISALKETFEVLKSGIEESKKDGSYETTKIKFIDIQMNEIRFNRKNLFDADQRMGFLHTFLSKTIPAEMPAQKLTLDISYDQVSKANVNEYEWWIGEERGQMKNEEGEQKIVRVQNEEMKALRQLAKSFSFVTEVRKNIFFELMSSADYIQATKRILELKSKPLPEIATVLVEVNIREPQSYNPFYSLVASKIAEEIPKFRLSLQFSLWDRFKQMNSFDARKLSNLAKFSAWIISAENSNCSLSIFKFFPDLTNLQSQESVFMKVFFREFFRKVKKPYLLRLSQKLKEEKNKLARDGIKDLLGEFKQQFKTQPQKIRQNLNVLRKMLLIQEQNQFEIAERN